MICTGFMITIPNDDAISNTILKERSVMICWHELPVDAERQKVILTGASVACIQPHFISTVPS